MNKNYAKQLLVYYMQKVWEAAGLHWDSDNAAEVESIIDEIISATIDEIVSATNDNPTESGFMR